MKFISSAVIYLRSGKGGDGIISWRRESHVNLGGPAGGSGGNGGSIYIEADENLNSLFHVRHIKSLVAKDGETGKNKSQHGKNAEDITLKVPCGTNVVDNKTGLKLFDLIRHGEKYLVCKGGSGGKGNVAFKSARKPAPYLYELGDPPEEKVIELSLEIIADIGLLGKPNAGKSSLLNLISNAKPKIASFPFTTLVPVLGTVSYKNKKLVFADIPGLITNASNGAGLGIEFLKHLNRCKALLHIVDASEENVLDSIKDIEQEVLIYSQELSEKPRILVLNKIDLISEEYLSLIKNKLDKEVICISALKNKNIDALLSRVFDICDSFITSSKSKLDFLEIKDDENMFSELEIQHNDNKWFVFHPALKYWIYKIPRDTSDNIARLFQKLNTLGVNQALVKQGIKKFDLVNIYGWEYEFLGE